MEVSSQLHAPVALPPGKSAGTHWIGGVTHTASNKIFSGGKDSGNVKQRDASFYLLSLKQ
jgi:hypothetical protein